MANSFYLVPDLPLLSLNSETSLDIFLCQPSLYSTACWSLKLLTCQLIGPTKEGGGTPDEIFSILLYAPRVSLSSSLFAENMHLFLSFAFDSFQDSLLYCLNICIIYSDLKVSKDILEVNVIWARLKRHILALFCYSVGNYCFWKSEFFSRPPSFGK